MLIAPLFGLRKRIIEPSVGESTFLGKHDIGINLNTTKKDKTEIHTSLSSPRRTPCASTNRWQNCASCARVPAVARRSARSPPCSVPIPRQLKYDTFRSIHPRTACSPDHL